MKVLFRLADGTGAFWVRPSLQQQLDAETPSYNRTFKYLQNSGYITALAENRFQVTDLARINLLKEIIKQRKSDGKLRVVIFDIPEKMKTSRNFFRRHLVELGFKMRQQSVWTSPLPCEDLVHLVVRYHGLGKYVDLIVGSLAPEY